MQHYVQDLCYNIITFILYIEESQQPDQQQHTSNLLFFTVLQLIYKTNAVKAEERTPPVTAPLQRPHVIVLCISLVNILSKYKSRGKANQQNLISISSTTSHPYFLPQPLKYLAYALSCLMALLQPTSAICTCHLYMPPDPKQAYSHTNGLILCNDRYFPQCAASGK